MLPITMVCEYILEIGVIVMTSLPSFLLWTKTWSADSILPAVQNYLKEFENIIAQDGALSLIKNTWFKNVIKNVGTFVRYISLHLILFLKISIIENSRALKSPVVVITITYKMNVSW